MLEEEVSQKKKDKYHMISLISGIYHMAQMNLSTENKIIDLETRLVVAKGEGVGWIGSLALTDTIYWLLEWISNEILLCSTEKYVQILTREHEYGRKIMYTCMCIWVPMLYSGKKRVLGEITIIKKKNMFTSLECWFQQQIEML